MKYSHQTNIYSFDDSSPTAFWHHLLHVEISMVQQKKTESFDYASDLEWQPECWKKKFTPTSVSLQKRFLVFYSFAFKW